MYNEITLDIPMQEPKRQYYYMEKCRQCVRELEKERGHALKFFVRTFGCQMAPATWML